MLFCRLPGPQNSYVGRLMKRVFLNFVAKTPILYESWEWYEIVSIP